ncbi:hypothetical protein P875_00075808 [Aspergillus parasiticus SU-1]|uniref:Uncharacterized protein n=1 Tax=Aspergillus parasiticus (strain ATCC 56775 / NRRL 5862 / SRRC 143 / SU-1) TaxID=1403190 RepID=A0A0F0IPL5_ASPPU|nr:hypothetical protein P875_00075808 [Aspergillus parasiticus SU-1]
MRVTSLLTLVSTFALLAAAAPPAAIVGRQSNVVDTPLSLDDLAAKFESLTAQQQDDAVKKLSPAELLRVKNCYSFKDLSNLPDKTTCPEVYYWIAELADVNGLLDAFYEKDPQAGVSTGQY